MEDLGLRLRKIRKHMKLSQQKFSRKFGITQQTLSRYENNKLAIPDDLKISLSQYGINMNWFLTGKGEMFLDQDKTESYNDVPARTREAEQIKALEKEIEHLKKNIRDLQAERNELADKNQELNVQLRLRLEELVSAKNALINAISQKCR